MNDRTKRWFEYEGLRIRYIFREGEDGAIPLLKFNGIGHGLEAWQPLVKEMPYTGLIAYDCPGVGESDLPPSSWTYSQHARLAVALLDHLGVERANILGLSWGGGLAQQFCLNHAERTNRLVLAASVIGAVMAPGRLRTYALMKGTRRFTDQAHFESIAGEIYGGDFRGKEGAVRDSNLLDVGCPSDDGYLFQTAALIGWSSLPFLWRLQQHVLVIHGVDDPLVPVINARILACLIPNSELRLLDCGHLFTVTRATETAAAIHDFLGG